jgi:hypothetical protein
MTNLIAKHSLKIYLRYGNQYLYSLVGYVLHDNLVLFGFKLFLHVDDINVNLNMIQEEK